MPRRRRLIWSVEAEQDLFDISAYLTSKASARIAERYLREIGRAAERTRTRALPGRARDELMSGMRSVLVHPYVIFFQVAASSVEIVRVLHQRRDLESIFADDVDG
jgi:toxin ParE1/3/4